LSVYATHLVLLRLRRGTRGQRCLQLPNEVTFAGACKVVAMAALQRYVKVAVLAWASAEARDAESRTRSAIRACLWRGRMAAGAWQQEQIRGGRVIAGVQRRLREQGHDLIAGDKVNHVRFDEAIVAATDSSQHDDIDDVTKGRYGRGRGRGRGRGSASEVRVGAMVHAGPGEVVATSTETDQHTGPLGGPTLGVLFKQLQEREDAMQMHGHSVRNRISAKSTSTSTSTSGVQIRHGSNSWVYEEGKG